MWYDNTIFDIVPVGAIDIIAIFLKPCFLIANFVFSLKDSWINGHSIYLSKSKIGDIPFSLANNAYAWNVPGLLLQRCYNL